MLFVGKAARVLQDAGHSLSGQSLVARWRPEAEALETAQRLQRLAAAPQLNRLAFQSAADASCKQVQFETCQ